MEGSVAATDEQGDANVRKASLATPGVGSLSRVAFLSSLWLKCPLKAPVPTASSVSSPSDFKCWLLREQLLDHPLPIIYLFLQLWGKSERHAMTTFKFIREKRDLFSYVFLPRRKQARRETHLNTAPILPGWSLEQSGVSARSKRLWAKQLFRAAEPPHGWNLDFEM